MMAHWRNLANTINLRFLGPSRVHNANGKSIGSAIFAQITAEYRYIYNGRPFPLNITLSHEGSGPPSN